MKRIDFFKKEQKRIFKLVTGEFPKYYLTGGTALAFYFGHRLSVDLDFFTQRYSEKDPLKIMRFIAKKTGYKFELFAEHKGPQFVSMKRYNMELGRGKGISLVIDFVQDGSKNLKSVKQGIHSIEDIYYRKVGIGVGRRDAAKNEIGKEISTGRQTAKDIFDIFFLSKKFMPLSDFFFKYYSTKHISYYAAWYRSMDRLELKLELRETVGIQSPEKVLEHLDEEILKKLSRGMNNYEN